MTGPSHTTTPFNAGACLKFVGRVKETLGVFNFQGDINTRYIIGQNNNNNSSKLAAAASFLPLHHNENTELRVKIGSNFYY